MSSEVTTAPHIFEGYRFHAVDDNADAGVHQIAVVDVKENADGATAVAVGEIAKEKSPASLPANRELLFTLLSFQKNQIGVSSRLLAALRPADDGGGGGGKEVVFLEYETHRPLSSTQGVPQNRWLSSPVPPLKTDSLGTLVNVWPVGTSGASRDMSHGERKADKNTSQVVLHIPPPEQPNGTVFLYQEEENPAWQDTSLTIQGVPADSPWLVLYDNLLSQKDSITDKTSFALVLFLCKDEDNNNDNFNLKALTLSFTRAGGRYSLEVGQKTVDGGGSIPNNFGAEVSLVALKTGEANSEPPTYSVCTVSRETDDDVKDINSERWIPKSLRVPEGKGGVMKTIAKVTLGETTRIQTTTPPVGEDASIVKKKLPTYVGAMATHRIFHPITGIDRTDMFALSSRLGEQDEYLAVTLCSANETHVDLGTFPGASRIAAVTHVSAFTRTRTVASTRDVFANQMGPLVTSFRTEMLLDWQKANGSGVGIFHETFCTLEGAGGENFTYRRSEELRVPDALAGFEHVYIAAFVSDTRYGSKYVVLGDSADGETFLCHLLPGDLGYRCTEVIKLQESFGRAAPLSGFRGSRAEVVYEDATYDPYTGDPFSAQGPVVYFLAHTGPQEGEGGTSSLFKHDPFSKEKQIVPRPAAMVAVGDDPGMFSAMDGIASGVLYHPTQKKLVSCLYTSEQDGPYFSYIKVLDLKQLTIISQTITSAQANTVYMSCSRNPGHLYQMSVFSSYREVEPTKFQPVLVRKWYITGTELSQDRITYEVKYLNQESDEAKYGFPAEPFQVRRLDLVDLGRNGAKISGFLVWYQVDIFPLHFAHFFADLDMQSYTAYVPQILSPCTGAM